MKNIPSQIRASLKPSLERWENNRETAEKISSLYPVTSGTLKTRKGNWEIYTRSSDPVPHFLEQEADSFQPGFSAVYKREGKPLSFVTGESVDIDTINQSLRTVSRKMAEQRWLFSHPLKSLNEEYGFQAGIKWGLRIMILLTVFVIFDLFLIPNYPEALAQGLSISFLGGDAAGLDFTGYQSLILRLITPILGEEYLYLAYSIYSLAAFFIIPILIFTVWTEIAGKRADKLRMKKLPPKALNFLYGFEAQKVMNIEYARLREEEKKGRLYRQLSGLGLKVSKEEFQKLYIEMLHG